MGAAAARVAADSSFVLSSPRQDAALGSDGADESGLARVRKGGFLLRWRRSDLISQVLNQPCNAATAMRLCANQSCLHSIYRDALPLHMRCRFDEAWEKRRQLNLSPLPGCCNIKDVILQAVEAESCILERPLGAKLFGACHQCASGWQSGMGAYA